MTPQSFVKTWLRAELSERASYQQHFLDLCELVDHPKPAETDPTGESFCFEKGAIKSSGGDGFADVWKRGAFAFEYKGRHKDLDRAYRQLLEYREALENPPLLVVCDTARIVIHTNFTATAKQVYDIPLAAIGEPRNLEVLRNLFFHPDKLRPGATSRAITEVAAARFADLAQRMRQRGLDGEAVARFLDRVVFCMFAEDVGLLPEGLFAKVVEKAATDPARLAKQMTALFAAMASGGDFGVDAIAHFNGDLFSDAPAAELTAEEIAVIRDAASLDWEAIDPSIFGTLFERGLDPSKRSQLGAHYTSREDIELLVEPVVMQPLRLEWAELRETIDCLLATGKKKPPAGKAPRPPTGGALKKAILEASLIKGRFLDRLGTVTVLDPACGSGNFLYVTLQKLKDLEKQVIVYGAEHGVATDLFPRLNPRQFHGIEINRYAYELAQMSLWIGYLQWTRYNGFAITSTPILEKITGFHCMDAILDLSDPEHPKEPEWPKVDFIVGNPPFLGGKLLRSQMGDEYIDTLFKTYDGRVPREADLVCYWFEKARAQIERNECQRAGLLATQGIRGGANREVLKRVKETGGIFFAVSDRDWILDGANVHVSMVGFDDGTEHGRVLDGQPVGQINTNLTAATADITQAARLPTNADLAFMGDTKVGPFDVAPETAIPMLNEPNPGGRPNSDVLRLWANGMDVTRAPRGWWIIDFAPGMTANEASLYERPFEYISRHVRPMRADARSGDRTGVPWWIHQRPRPDMRGALVNVARYVATPTVAKHRLFAFLESCILPDHQLIVFARDDDYFFGVLHSRFHEVWALRMGTRLEDRPRYTPTTCFETFPFPAPTDAQRTAIGQAAAELNQLRERWLNPPEWTRQEVLTFPGSVDGPWLRYVKDPNAHGIGTVHYPRLVPADDKAAAELKKRTLTNLYNARPAWLRNAHRTLDEAVAAAYGFSVDVSEEELLARLLDLNLNPPTASA